MTNLVVPNHIAFIMDGNRRWAKSKHLPIFQGHNEGEKRIEPLIDASIGKGIKFLTFWAFSTENWKREKKEVGFLISLFRYMLDKKINSYHKKNVRLKIIGDINSFPEDIIKKSKEWTQKTRKNTKITVSIALSYGGRDEIIRAVNKWSRSNQKGKDITKEEFAKYLDTKGQPDPDLLIRTGGENRLSGFLLWQLEYAELYFTDVLWPDFTPLEFDKALDYYRERQRRFGK